MFRDVVLTKSEALELFKYLIEKSVHGDSPSSQIYSSYCKSIMEREEMQQDPNAQLWNILLSVTVVTLFLASGIGPAGFMFWFLLSCAVKFYQSFACCSREEVDWFSFFVILLILPVFIPVFAIGFIILTLMYMGRSIYLRGFTMEAFNLTIATLRETCKVDGLDLL